IRLSLLVYFLILLGVALGAVSLLVYEITEQTLLAKKQKTHDLLVANNERTRQLWKEWQTARASLLVTQSEDREQLVYAKLDDDLLSEARTLARLAMVQYQNTRAKLSRIGGSRVGLGQPNLVMAGLDPTGPLLAALWVREGLPNHPEGVPGP